MVFYKTLTGFLWTWLQLAGSNWLCDTDNHALLLNFILFQRAPAHFWTVCKIKLLCVELRVRFFPRKGPDSLQNMSRSYICKRQWQHPWRSVTTTSNSSGNLKGETHAWLMASHTGRKAAASIKWLLYRQRLWNPRSMKCNFRMRKEKTSA